MGGEYNVLLQIQLNAESALGVESQNSDGEGHDRKFLYTTAWNKDQTPAKNMHASGTNVLTTM